MESTPIELVLLKQTSLTEDSIAKNGTPRILHVVVKNSPFSITFGFPTTSTATSTSISTDLHDYNVEAKLLYDSDIEKEVDFVKAKPLLAKITLNQTGSKMTVEGRIKVLTSQLENSLFRMGIFVYDRQTKELAFPITYSEAIKVISKSDQVKKKKITADHEDKKKRNISDVLSDALEYIEAKQSEQVELLENLMENTEYNVSELLKAVNSAPNFQDLSNLQSTLPSVHSLDNCEKPFVSTSPSENFDKAFKTFLSSYTQLHSEQKPAKIRKVVSTAADMSDFMELLDLFWAEGLSREATTNMQQKVPQSSEIGHSHVCPCQECPYKKELVRIENFYDDIFSQQQATPFAFKPTEVPIGMEQLHE